MVVSTNIPFCVESDGKHVVACVVCFLCAIMLSEKPKIFRRRFSKNHVRKLNYIDQNIKYLSELKFQLGVFSVPQATDLDA